MDQREEIKEKIDLVELIGQYIELKKAGRNFKANCPFHKEKTPSFVVSPERQIFKCFGCAAGGDHFAFLMRMENMDFVEALQELAKRAGVKLKNFRLGDDEKKKQELYEINHLASEFFHFLLLNHPVGKTALNYLLSRGLKKETMVEFKVGFAPDSFQSLQQFLVGKKKYKPEDLEKAGLISQGSRGFFDRFRNRVMFPFFDHRGNITGFSGRVLPGTEDHAKYVNTPETLVFHKSNLLYGLFQAKEEIRQKETAVLVEGQMDVLSSHQAEVKNVVASGGTALAESQIRLLKRFTNKFIFALDQDLAGDRAARRGIELADAQEVEIEAIEIKGGKDPDEIASQSAKKWQQMVKRAVGVYDFLIDSAFNRFGDQGAAGKRKIGQEIAPVLAKINNQIVFSHYVSLLAQKLGVEAESIVEEIEKVKPGGDTDLLEKKETPPVEVEKLRRQLLEEYLLALALQAQQYDWLKKRKLKSLVKTASLKRILDILVKYLKKVKKFSSTKLAKKLPAELLETFNQLYLINLGDLFEDEEKAEKQFEKAFSELVRVDLREKLDTIGHAIDQLEAKKDKTKTEKQKLEKLVKEFASLSQQQVE